MVVSPVTLIAIGVITMFFGYFFGLWEGRGQGYKKRKKEEALDTSGGAEVQNPLPPPSPPVVTAAPIVQPQPAEKSLLQLSMDALQQPCLDIDGQRVDTVQMAPQQRKRLIDLMVLMRPWIDSGPAQKGDSPASAPAHRPVVAVARPTVPPDPSAPVTLSTPARVISIFGSTPPPAEPVSAPTSLVGQIDAILQTRLIGTPLADRGIKLVESAQGDAMVVVGANRYTGVGEVPDPEVQAAIRAAIAEWENRYTPG